MIEVWVNLKLRLHFLRESTDHCRAPVNCHLKIVERDRIYPTLLVQYREHLYCQLNQ